MPDIVAPSPNPGLSSAEALARKAKFGANAMPDITEHLLKAAL